MRLMTTAAPRVDRGALDGFETLTLRPESSRRRLPGAGMAGVSLRHAGAELLDRQAGLKTYVERGAVLGIPILDPWATGRRLSTTPSTGGPFGSRMARRSCAARRRAADPRPAQRLPPLARPLDRARFRPCRLSAVLDFGAHPELLAAFRSLTRCASTRTSTTPD
jgi:hypothetical protein